MGFCVSQLLYVQSNFLYDSDVFVFILVCIYLVTVKSNWESELC